MGSLIGSAFRDAAAASFNGTDEYAYCDNPSFKGDTRGAFLMRITPTTIWAINGFREFIGMGVKATNDSAFTIGMRRNNAAGIAVPYRNASIPEVGTRKTNGGTYNAAYAQHLFVAGTPITMVVQGNLSTWEVYINGSPITIVGWQGSGNTSHWLGELSGSDHRLSFGAGWFSNGTTIRYSPTKMNECIYVDRSLTSGEVTEWHNGGVALNANRLSFKSVVKSWWRMGDSRDSATTIYDEVGSNHLTLVNMDASNYVTP
jgi:hypothetical protein